MRQLYSLAGGHVLAARPFQGQTAVRLWPFGLDTRPVHTGLYNLWPQVVPGAGQQGGSVVLLSLSKYSLYGVVRFLKGPASVLLKLKLLCQESIFLLLDDSF